MSDTPNTEPLTDEQIAERLWDASQRRTNIDTPEWVCSWHDGSQIEGVMEEWIAMAQEVRVLAAELSGGDA